MIWFVSAAAALLALALGFVVWPFLRHHRATASRSRDEANAVIYREQLAELDAERAAGLVSEARYAEVRADTERRLAEDLGTRETDRDVRVPSGRLLGTGVSAFVVAGAVLLYALVGTPGGLDPQAGTPPGPHQFTQQEIEAMVTQLQQRLRERPDDVEGWTVLARSQRVLGRFDESAAAYAKLIELGAKSADVLADYADVLATSRGRGLAGEPERMVREALELDPNHVKALALAGSAEFQRGNFAGAIPFWERLLAQVPPESELYAGVQKGIADARSRMGEGPAAGPVSTPPAATASPAAVRSEAITGTVSLSPSIAGRAAPEDTVFVLARPADGSRMPLAVVRIRVKDLPYSFTLDDTMAMAPSARLSSHAEVVVIGRVARSGNPGGASGDLEGVSPPVRPGARDIRIVISNVLD